MGDALKNIKVAGNRMVLWILFVFVLGLTSAHAQESMTSSILANQLQNSNSKKWLLELSLEHASNLASDSNPDRNEATSLIIIPMVSFSEKSNLEARMDLIQRHDSENQTKTSNTVIVYTPTRVDFSEELKFKPKISVTLPSDIEARDDLSYQGSIGFVPTLEYTVSRIKGLTLLNAVYFSKNFHEYEQQRNYKPNTEYSIRNRFVVYYAVTEKFSVELINDFVKSWSYGSFARDNFYFAQVLEYKFIRNWSTYLLHKNEGSVRGPNNHGENVDLFSEKSSYIAMGLSHVF